MLKTHVLPPSQSPTFQIIGPNRLADTDVDCRYLGQGDRDIHDSVDHQGNWLEVACPNVGVFFFDFCLNIGLPVLSNRQVGEVIPVDLVE